MGAGILHKYGSFIDLQGANPISMGEGDTPVSYTHLTLPTTPYV